VLQEVALKAGETALVHAVAGGVGNFAVQLAKIRGAHVMGTARQAHHQFLREKLGLDNVIDYSQKDFREGVKSKYPQGVDVVLDFVGGEVLEKSIDVLKPQGRLCSIVNRPNAELMSARGVQGHYVFVSPSGAQLTELRPLIEAGKIKTFVNTELPLAEAAKAHELLESRRTEGKIVLLV